MRLFNSIRRPFGGFMVDPGERQAEAARAVEDRFSHHIDRKLNIEFGRLTRKMEIFMGNVQERLREVIEVVKSQNSKIDSLNTLMDGMRNEVQRLLTNAGTDDTTMALVDQLFDSAKANSEAIDAALAENQGGEPLPLRPISDTVEAEAQAKAAAAAEAQAKAEQAVREAEAASRAAEAAAARKKADAEAAAAASSEPLPTPAGPDPMDMGFAPTQPAPDKAPA
jgi:uncharacterized protein YoxC